MHLPRGIPGAALPWSTLFVVLALGSSLSAQSALSSPKAGPAAVSAQPAPSSLATASSEATPLDSTASPDSPSPVDSTTLAVSSWLVVPAQPLPLPALHDEPRHELKWKDLVEAPPAGVEELWPAAGVSWHGPRRTLRWEEIATGPEGLDLASMSAPADSAVAQQALAAFYLGLGRFARVTLELHGGPLLQLFVDGEKAKLEKAEGKDGDGGDGTWTASLPLTRGKHRVLVRAARGPGDPDGWKVAAAVKTAGGVQPFIELVPQHALSLGDLLDARSIDGLTLSEDGRLLAYRLREPSVPSEDRRSWWEIRSTRDGHLVRSFEGEGKLGSFAWVPGEGQRYSFTTSDEGKTTLWLAGLEGQATEMVLEKVEHFGGYRWLPDASGVVYTVTEKGRRKHDDFKHYENLADRWSDYRDKGYLHFAPWPAGQPRRLTAGMESTRLLDIAPDGRFLLFSRELYDRTERPFSITEYYELDLDDLTLRKLFESKWAGAAAYAPDGRTIAVQGGPEAFGRVGVALPQGVIPNDYDEQLYLLDRDDLQVRSITLDFDPSVGAFRWSRKDGALYCTAETGSRVLLYRWDPGKEHFEELPNAGDVAGRLTLSRDGTMLAYLAESSKVPERIFVQKAQGKSKPQLLAAPNAERFDRVVFGRVEDWDFQASDGTTIIGRIYYPPGFEENAGRKWPLIVYYYGGTSPVTRDFGGRYPKNWWAANGYVVYVLQPSGATGFGQAFSARHVNDWGRHAGRDILEGTEAFLAAHDFVDPERVGCIGASYGGFMTEYLVSHSDLFAGAVSHAGISFLGSYWGQGDWGAFYSAVATAGKYPWNAADLYVQQGSFFSADRIHTPLLLLHGDIDNNVPPGESEQLYTALKVLGREVDFIRIGGEKHWILEYPHRKLWSETIVAWFDRTLKGDRSWWDFLWGQGEDEGAGKKE